MKAEIIPFPGTRARPLEANELPEHWPEKLRQHYLYVTYDGYNSHEDAFRYCETMAAVEPRRDNESYMDYLLRMAKAELSTAPRKEA